MTRKIMLMLTMSLVCLAIVALTYGDLLTQGLQKMRFDGKQDHSISLAEACNMARNYQAKIAPGEVIGGYFGEDAIAAILLQEGTTGLRYYFGENDDGSRHIILVGVDEQGDDLVDGLLADKSGECPPFCSKANVLNTPQMTYSVNF